MTLPLDAAGVVTDALQPVFTHEPLPAEVVRSGTPATGVVAGMRQGMSAKSGRAVSPAGPRAAASDGLIA